MYSALKILRLDLRKMHIVSGMRLSKEFKNNESDPKS